MSGNHHHNARRAWRRTLSVPAQRRSAPRVRAFVRELAYVAGFSQRSVEEIELAVGEAVTNAILYGHGQPERGGSGAHDEIPLLSIDVGMDGGMLFVEVCDPGPGFDLERIRRSGQHNTEDLGGRGLDLMDALMDHVHFQFDGSGTRVRMERLLSPGP